MFPFGSGGTSSSVDPDKVRDAPPRPTVIYFPQNDIHVQAHDDWPKQSPNLFDKYASVTKPSDLQHSHIEALNVTIKNDVPLEDLIPNAHTERSNLPPSEWIANLDPTVRRASLPIIQKGPERHLVLSNGHKAPSHEDFTKYAQELACSTEDGLLAIGRRRQRKGHVAPHLNHYRDFWVKLEVISQYWDDSKDNYFHPESSSAPSSPTSPTSSKAFRRMSHFIMSEKHTVHGQGKTSESDEKYTGWRNSNGARMPDRFRLELIRSFVRPIVLSFHCEPIDPRKTPQLEIGKLLVPVTQTSVAWRMPEDKNLVKRGVMEGPVFAVQVRHETSFAKKPELAALDTAREVACLMLLAQERAREGRPKRIPGANQWYTTKPRWGGGPGGEFGEAEGNTDEHPATKRLTYVPGGIPRRMSEEEIWKQLKPNSGLWQPRTEYVAVGKDRNSRLDSVFLVTSLFHHIAFVRMDVDPAYLDLITFGKEPPLSIPNKSWHKPIINRTRWYNLLEAEARLEAFRGLWGLTSYLMRVDGVDRPTSSRQHSEGRSAPTGGRGGHIPKSNLQPQRSHSVAF